MRKTLLASAATAIILAAGVASADEITANVELELTVDAACAMSATEFIQASLVGAFLEDGSPTIGSSAVGNGFIQVACNAGLPYTLETNAGPQGAITLVGDSTGVSIPGAMLIGPVNTPFGNQANGEAYAAVGDGQFQMHPFQVQFNRDYSGNFFPVPAADTYRGNEAITLTF